MNLKKRCCFNSVDEAAAQVMSWIRDDLENDREIDPIVNHFVVEDRVDKGRFLLVSHAWEPVEAEIWCPPTIQFVNTMRPEGAIMVETRLSAEGDLEVIWVVVQRRDLSVTKYQLKEDDGGLSPVFQHVADRSICTGEDFPLTAEGWEITSKMDIWCESLERIDHPVPRELLN